MNPFTQPNIESLSKLEVIPAGNIVSITPVNTNPLAQINVELLYGASFEEIPFTIGTGEMTENTESDDSGEYLSQQITIEVPKTRREVDEWIDKRAMLDLVLAVTDMHGNVRLVGSPDQPARLSVTNTNPASGRNSYTFSFNAVSEDAAPYLQYAGVSNALNIWSNNFSANFLPNIIQ